MNCAAINCGIPLKCILFWWAKHHTECAFLFSDLISNTYALQNAYIQFMCFTSIQHQNDRVDLGLSIFQHKNLELNRRRRFT